MADKIKLEFDSENHIYYRDGKEIISTTQLLKKHQLATDYTGVSERVLNRAAAHGIVVHEAIQQYIETHIVDEMIPEVHEFIQLCLKQGIVPKKSEQMYCNDVYAGTIDVICADGSLIDIKTAKALDKTYATWQLSLYKKLLEDNGQTVNRLFIAHLSDTKSELIEVTPIPVYEVERLISAERADIYYMPEEPQLPAEVMSGLVDAEKQITYYASLIDKVKKSRDEFLSGLLLAMEETGVKKYENEEISITYVAPQTRETFDSKRFRADCPKLYKEYVKESEVKASVRIKLKGATDD